MSDDLTTLYLAFRANAFQQIASLAPALSGTEIKIMLHLSRIANPLTRTAESSQSELAAAIHTGESHVRQTLKSLNRREMVVPGKRRGPLRTVYHLLFLDTVQFAATPAKLIGVDEGRVRV